MYRYVFDVVYQGVPKIDGVQNPEVTVFAGSIARAKEKAKKAVDLGPKTFLRLRSVTEIPKS